MFNRDLIFIESFSSEFNGEKYEIYKFLDPITLSFINGTNLDYKNLEAGKSYKCVLSYKRSRNIDKVVVTKVI